MAERTCIFDGCDAVHYGKGWCAYHYARARRTGAPDGSTRRPTAQRFWSKVEKRGPDECWEWQGGISPDGYGQFNPNAANGPKGAHRFSFWLVHGVIPGPGREVDHLCRNRACVNPAHLEDVTKRENILRGEGIAALNARKTSCHRGHEYNPENLYINPAGSRVCRTCHAEAKRRYKARQRARKRAERTAA